MRGNIAQLMQQAQKMQENLQRAQEELAKLEVTGTAGGGMVSVTLTGAKECRKVRIDPSILSDQEMAEDLIAAAFNDASNKIDAESKDRMGSATAGSPFAPQRRYRLAARMTGAVPLLAVARVRPLPAVSLLLQ